MCPNEPTPSPNRLTNTIRILHETEAASDQPIDIFHLYQHQTVDEGPTDGVAFLNAHVDFDPVLEWHGELKGDVFDYLERVDDYAVDDDEEEEGNEGTDRTASYEWSEDDFDDDHNDDDYGSEDEEIIENLDPYFDDVNGDEGREDSSDQEISDVEAEHNELERLFGLLREYEDEQRSEDKDETAHLIKEEDGNLDKGEEGFERKDVSRDEDMSDVQAAATIQEATAL
ncbi:hypothetical protein Q7P37_006824 [Cladosporium fusiforme]